GADDEGGQRHNPELRDQGWTAENHGRRGDDSRLPAGHCLSNLLHQDQPVGGAGLGGGGAAGVISMEKTKQNPAQTLMEGIGFTEDDLEANRQGILTEAQRIRIGNPQDDWPNYVGLLFYGGGLIVLVSFAFQRPSESSQPVFILIAGG